MKRGRFWVFTYVILSVTSLSDAQTVAFTFDGPLEACPDEDATDCAAVSLRATDGFKFKTSVDVVVTDLGYYDWNQDGLVLSHEVGIYEFDTQQLLVSTDVDSTSFLSGAFRYSPIEPFTLNAGISYLLAGYHPGSTDPVNPEDRGANILGADDVDTADEIDLEAYFFSESSQLVFPLISFEPFRYFGPNLRFTLAGDIADFDFNDDGQANCTDINALATAVANNTPDARFDLNNDFQLDLFDVEDWLLGAGVAVNGAAYANGDANLDGTVNDGDLAAWESGRFMAGDWCGGDFNADGLVDGSDFNIWNNSYQSSPAATPVPEPSGLTVMLAALGLHGMLVASRSMTPSTTPAHE